MILFNGGSHACASYCVNMFKSGHEDSQHWQKINEPHPENWQHSYARKLGLLIQNPVHPMCRTNNTVSDIVNQYEEFLKLKPEKQDVLLLIHWPECTHKELKSISKWRKKLKYRVLDYTTTEYIRVLEENDHNADIFTKHYNAEAHSFYCNYLLKIFIDKRLF